MNRSHRRSDRRLVLEPLEDRTLMSACHVVRLADLNAGHDLGTGHARGSLRYCINFANSNPGPDTIDFKVTGTIQLTSALPDLVSDMTIIGPGADALSVSGPGYWNASIFFVNATVTISGLTLTHSYRDSAAGGIRNFGSGGGTLTLKDCTIADNKNWFAEVGYGGAIANWGKMTISGCTISGNETEFSDIDAVGGGIYNGPAGVMQINNSTISGNSVDFGTGEAIYNEGSLDIRFSTITANAGQGAAILHDSAFGGSLKLYNTIVAGNGGTDLSGGYTGSANLIGGDPMLGPLQYNGGPTQTHAVLPGSPAIDAGDNTFAPEWDQRGPGFPRIINGTIDIGAFEVQSAGVSKPPSDGSNPPSDLTIPPSLFHEAFRGAVLGPLLTAGSRTPALARTPFTGFFDVRLEPTSTDGSSQTARSLVNEAENGDASPATRRQRRAYDRYAGSPVNGTLTDGIDISRVELHSLNSKSNDVSFWERQ